jgi:hypothetical protein
MRYLSASEIWHTVRHDAIHPSAWNRNSQKLNFRFTEFYEVQEDAPTTPCSIFAVALVSSGLLLPLDVLREENLGDGLLEEERRWRRGRRIEPIDVDDDGRIFLR